MKNKIEDYHISSGRSMKENGDFINIANLLQGTLQATSDQAGRFRSSQPIPLGDYKLLNSRLPQFFDTVTNGTANVAYNSNKKSHDITTIADGDYAIVQTYQRHNYFAGKSQFVEFTTFDFNDEANVEKRFGYYSSGTVAPYQSNLDGFYLYSDGTSHYLRIMNNGTEILNLPQSEWDDPLDGTGESGFSIDWETFNVFQFSFLWLGGTGLRFSLVVGSRIIQVHNYEHVGSANADKLIFSSPNQPIRMEVIQSGVGVGRFQPVCCTVITEGSEASGNVGEISSIDSGAAASISLSYPERGVIKGIRLQDGKFDTIIDFEGVAPFSDTNNDYYKWEVVINPDIVDGAGVAKALTFTDVDELPTQQATGDGDTFAVGGSTLYSGYGSAQSAFNRNIISARKLGASIAGLADEAYLLISPLQGTVNINCFGGISYKVFI